jgi:hypothetical protein
MIINLKRYLFFISWLLHFCYSLHQTYLDAISKISLTFFLLENKTIRIASKAKKG